MTVIYAAKKILTHNPARPVATHVAVRDRRILGVGSLEELKLWGDASINEQFADKILMPGFVEGHSHTMEGMFWRHVYVGFFDRMAPDGEIWTGLHEKGAVIDRLRSYEARLDNADQPLTAWSLDPIYFDGSRINRHDLDAVSTTRPIGVLHASVHIMNVNTKALELAGLLREGIDHEGVPLDKDGLPTGELKGPDVMTPAGMHVGFDEDMLACDEQGLWDFARLAVRTGVTTATDLASRLSEDVVDTALRVTSDQEYPLRVVPLRFHHGLTPKQLIDQVLTLKQRSTTNYAMGRIKVVADGSIQGFSARINWPGYINGEPNGMWYIAPEQLREIYELALYQGINVHTHTNGDEATDLVLDMLEVALRKHPSFDHRFTIQHGQLISQAQFRRMKQLGMCVNLFANHHYYWGEEHYEQTVGPERALRMNACRSALNHQLPLAIHSDAPITPLAPLFTAWAAVTRETRTGRVQGEFERIEVSDALYAITLGAAYTLHLDHLIGSIEVGKYADFAVLEQDPMEVSVDNLKSVPVWGTVQGGRVFPARSM